MGSAGRPQGQLRGETEQANELARFVREMTHGATVRELARRHPRRKDQLDRARQAQREAEVGVAKADELIRVLVVVVAELRGELGAGDTDEAGSAARLRADGDTAEPRRARLWEATRCLAEVRRIRRRACEAQGTAQREQEAVGLLVDQERTPVRPPARPPARADGRTAAETETEMGSRGPNWWCPTGCGRICPCYGAWTLSSWRCGRPWSTGGGRRSG